LQAEGDQHQRHAHYDAYPRLRAGARACVLGFFARALRRQPDVNR
jgi:hypothetical protein